MDTSLGLKHVFDHVADGERAQDLGEVDLLALLAVLTENGDALDTLEFHPRKLIDLLKNSLKPLEFFLAFLQKSGHLVSTGSYHFTDVKDVRTFDLYNKYELTFTNCFKEVMPEAHWEHVKVWAL